MLALANSKVHNITILELILSSQNAEFESIIMSVKVLTFEMGLFDKWATHFNIYSAICANFNGLLALSRDAHLRLFPPAQALLVLDV